MVLVKGEITITKGFETWKIYYQSKDKLEEYGISFLFAGTQMDDETKLHVVMKFDSMEALENLETMTNSLSAEEKPLLLKVEFKHQFPLIL